MAQDLLCQAKQPVAVLQQVNASTMTRASRLLQTEIVLSTDVTRRNHALGHCDKFTLKRMRGPSKTAAANTAESNETKSENKQNKNKEVISAISNTEVFAFIEGCPRELGASIVLRGGSRSELNLVKQVVKEMIYRAYNWKCQSACMLDCFMSLESLNDDRELDRELFLSKTTSSEQSNPSKSTIKSNIKSNTTNNNNTKKLKDELTNGVMYDIRPRDIVALGTTTLRNATQLKTPTVEEYKAHGYSDQISATIRFPVPSEIHEKETSETSDTDELLKMDPDCSLGSYLLCRFNETTPTEAIVKDEEFLSRANITSSNKTKPSAWLHQQKHRPLLSRFLSKDIKTTTTNTNNTAASLEDPHSKATRPTSVREHNAIMKQKERDLEHTVDEYFYYRGK